MSSYFPTMVLRQQYVHRQETIDKTVPLPDEATIRSPSHGGSLQLTYGASAAAL